MNRKAKDSEIDWVKLRDETIKKYSYTNHPSILKQMNEELKIIDGYIKQLKE